MRLRVIGSIRKENRILTSIKYIEGTEFYPDGKGGQLGDRGSIGDAQVLEVDREGNLFLDIELGLGEHE